MKNVKFTESPTGRFNLGYNVGDIVPLEDKQAAEVVEAGYGYYVDAETAAKSSVPAAKKSQKAIDKQAADAEKR